MMYHTPVLVQEVLEGLEILKGKKYIDGTVGGGGHALEIVKRGGQLLGIDTDSEALSYARQTFESAGYPEQKKQWKLIKGNFRNIEKIALENGFGMVDGVMLDLGVSSHQLDAPERGFSYRFRDAPLDFRFAHESGITGEDVVNTYSEDELYEIFAKFGEEKRARSIAHAVVVARHMKRLTTGADLLRILQTGEGNDEHALHSTASRIFQALRIEVNDELGALKEAVSGAYNILNRNGRIAIISFHSLEDRIVKIELKKSVWKALHKRPVTASEQELYQNRRSRSAKLRIAEKIV